MNRILVLIHIAVLLISCNVSKKEEQRKVFRYNSENGITSLDPAFASNQDNIWAVNQLFNGLIQLDNKLNPKPCIAKRWEIDSTGKIYTFHLRNDVYFHPSTIWKPGMRKVSAHDFVYSYNRIMDPETASPGAWIFNNRVAQNGFIALDDTTFQIHLMEAFAPFIDILTMPYCFVVPKEAVEFYGKDFGHHPIGSGPFTFKQWEQDISLVLHKNPNYFESDVYGLLPHVDAVQISFITNKQIALLKFKEGHLDLFNGITGTTKDVILTKDGSLQSGLSPFATLDKSPFLNTEYLGINLDSGRAMWPWNNADFRKAVNFAIDREKMLRNMRNSIGTPGNLGFVARGLLPENKIGYGYEYNPSLAKEFLAKSGYPSQPVAIDLTTTKDYLDLCVFVQKQLSDIGIECAVDVVPSSELKQQKRNGNLAFFRASWIMDYPNAENYLSCFYSQNFSPNGPNYTHYKNKPFDELYLLSLQETNPNTLKASYLQMDSLIMAQAPIVVLYYDESVRLLNKRVQNLENNPLNNLVLKYARIE